MFYHLLEKTIIFIFVSKVSLAFVPSRNNAMGVSLQNDLHITSYQNPNNIELELRKKQWTDESLDYYFRLLRENSSTTSYNKLQDEVENMEIQLQMEQIAKRLYFARKKIKVGAPRHAERIYRKIIHDILFSPEMDETCHHSAFAVSTLLLALLLQRQGEVKEARAVFINFFRKVDTHGTEDLHCSCSAKVFQAFALFEMKQGNELKSLELVSKAINMDQSLITIFKWKQFRDAYERLSSTTRYSHVKSQLNNIFEINV